MTMTYYNVRLVRVVDADTVHLDVDLGFNTWRINEPYRLAKVNAPELSTTEGKTARDALMARIAGLTPITIVCFGKDKYGRWLISLIVDGVNINDWLVLNHFAKPYELKEQLA